MDKIKVIPITTPKEALTESIKIWTVIANSPDGTRKLDVVEGGYSKQCPLCHLVSQRVIYIDMPRHCQKYICPLYSDESGYCNEIGNPYYNWDNDTTATNAQAVLGQLMKAKEKLENE
jgi:hypothetical protein